MTPSKKTISPHQPNKNMPLASGLLKSQGYFKVNDLHWASLGYLPSRLFSILYKTLSINGAWILFDFYHVMDYRIIRCNNFPFSERKYPLHVVHHNKDWFSLSSSSYSSLLANSMTFLLRSETSNMIMSSVVHTLSSRCSLGYWEIGILDFGIYVT